MILLISVVALCLPQTFRGLKVLALDASLSYKLLAINVCHTLCDIQRSLYVMLIKFIIHIINH